jgi:hypothetical protein
LAGPGRDAWLGGYGWLQSDYYIDLQQMIIVLSIAAPEKDVGLG